MLSCDHIWPLLIVIFLKTVETQLKSDYPLLKADITLLQCDTGNCLFDTSPQDQQGQYNLLYYWLILSVQVFKTCCIIIKTVANSGNLIFHFVHHCCIKTLCIYTNQRIKLKDHNSNYKNQLNNEPVLYFLSELRYHQTMAKVRLPNTVEKLQNNS